MFNKRKGLVWLSITVLIGVALYFLFSNYGLTEKKESYSVYTDSQKQLSLEGLLEILKKQESIDIHIYYIPFSSDGEEPTTEGHVFEVPFLKLTVENIVPFYHDYFEGFLHNISTATVKQNLPPYNDFRYCCLIKSKSNRYIRFSISKKSRDAIFINGQPYEVPFEVIDAFLKLLPARDYELAIKEIGVDKNLPTKK
jgi:hypothetical protein